MLGTRMANIQVIDPPALTEWYETAFTHCMLGVQ